MSRSETSGALPGVRWLFSTREGGLSSGRYESLNLADHVGDDPASVAGNRGILGGRIGLPVERLAVMAAAHGREVAVVADGGTVAAVDGLVTRAPGLGLLALAADCATVALADPQARVIGAVHAGWRGVAADAVGAAVAAMVAEGAAPERMSAAIGAVACPGCYEVSEEVRGEVAAAAPAAWAQTRKSTPAVDLQAGLEEQLRACGVTSIAVESDCTIESASLFSYRRDGVTGRHGMLIALTDAE